MLYHLSFNAEDTDLVAATLAELVDGRVLRAPAPPFDEGARFVCAADEHGTMVVVEPMGVVYGSSFEAGFGYADGERQGAVHGLLSTPLDEATIREVCGRVGWPVERVDNGPFEVLNVWVEDRFLIELMTPEMVPAYVATFAGDRLDETDAGLRALEAELRGAAVG